MHQHINISHKYALEKLLEGNKKYISAKFNDGDISQELRNDTLVNGQKPYAIIITCSDSRVVPENIFMTGLGELFVIRIAGNVIDEHQLGSIEYAAGHLGAPLILVLGHTHCGAVDAAINHDPEGYIKFITDKISLAIGAEKDPYIAACKNVEYVVKEIESSLEIKEIESEEDLIVMGAVYHLENGRVEFLDGAGGEPIGVYSVSSALL